jgi:hypothetical protein
MYLGVYAQVQSFQRAEHMSTFQVHFYPFETPFTVAMSRFNSEHRTLCRWRTTSTLVARGPRGIPCVRGSC